MTAIDPDDPLLPEEIAAELQNARIALTSQDLQAMIAAAKAAKIEPRAVDVFPLKVIRPEHVSYETCRRACASGQLSAVKYGGDWFATKEAMADWLASSGKFFESECAAQSWRAMLARLKPRWIA